MTPITLDRVVQTCTAAPSQWDAWDADGQYYYLRFRGGIGTVHAEPSPDESTWTSYPTAPGTPHQTGSVAHFQRSIDRYDSFITLQEFLELAGIKLAPGATVTPQHEESDMADLAYESDAAPAPAPAPPTPKSEGTYALFNLPDGGLLLAYRDKKEPEVDRRIPIPAFIVRMAEQAASGEGITPGMIGKLFGGAR